MFTSLGSTVTVYIDAKSGLLLTQKPLQPALWHSEVLQKPTCNDYIDAQYVEHTGKYLVEEWVYTEMDYHEYGSYSVSISVYDLQTLVNYAHEQGVWTDENSCSHSWEIMLEHVLRPLSALIGQQERNGRLSARQHGVAITMLCRLPRETTSQVCTPNLLTDITNGRKQTRRKKRDGI